MRDAPRQPPPSTALRLLVLLPDRRLPQLDLVAVGIHDPGELAVLVLLGPLDDRDAVLLELRENSPEIVDAVVDHEARRTRVEPLRLALGDVPDGEAAILRLVIGPPQDCAAPRLERQAEVIPIPGGEPCVVRRRLEEDAADPGHARHHHLRFRQSRTTVPSAQRTSPTARKWDGPSHARSCRRAS